MSAKITSIWSAKLEAKLAVILTSKLEAKLTTIKSVQLTTFKSEKLAAICPAKLAAIWPAKLSVIRFSVGSRETRISPPDESTIKTKRVLSISAQIVDIADTFAAKANSACVKSFSLIRIWVRLICAASSISAQIVDNVNALAILVATRATSTVVLASSANEGATAAFLPASFAFAGHFQLKITTAASTSSANEGATAAFLALVLLIASFVIAGHFYFKIATTTAASRTATKSSAAAAATAKAAAAAAAAAVTAAKLAVCLSVSSSKSAVEIIIAATSIDRIARQIWKVGFGRIPYQNIAWLDTRWTYSFARECENSTLMDLCTNYAVPSFKYSTDGFLVGKPLG